MNWKHGAGNEPWYSNLMAMVHRMTNPKEPAYQQYVVEKGLKIDKEKRKWDVRIYKHNKTIFVGRFADLDEAIKRKQERTVAV